MQGSFLKEEKLQLKESDRLLELQFFINFHFLIAIFQYVPKHIFFILLQNQNSASVKNYFFLLNEP